MNKKILVVTDATRIGGAEVYIHNLVKLFNFENYQFEIYGNSVLRYIIPNSIIGLLDNKKPLRTIYRFLCTFFKEKPDIVHLNLTHPLSCFWIQILSLFFINTNFFATLHSTVPTKRRKIFSKLLEFIFKKINIILVASSAKEELWDNYGLENKNMRIVPNWVDTEKYNIPSNSEREKNRRELQIDDNTKVGLFLGRFEDQKNVLELVQLCKKLIDVDDRWLIYMVGDGIQKEQVQNEIYNLKLNDKIILHPFTDNARKYYYIADVFLLISKYECAPLALLESMACGVSPVITDVGDMKVMVEDENVVYKGESFEEFMKCVEYSYNKETNYWRGIIERKYSPSVALKRMKEIYNM